MDVTIEMFSKSVSVWCGQQSEWYTHNVYPIPYHMYMYTVCVCTRTLVVITCRPLVHVYVHC